MSKLDAIRTLLKAAVVLLDTIDKCGSPSDCPRLGMNVGGLTDWSQQIELTNMAPKMRDWKPGGDYEIETDAQGWPINLKEGQKAECVWMANEYGSHRPSGFYRITWEGTGKLEMRFAKSLVTSHGSNHITLEAPAGSNNPLRFWITESDPNDHVRNIKIHPPGFYGSSGEPMWHPEFVDLLRPFDVLRFMDVMQTNNSPVVEWSDRKKLGDASWNSPRTGAPYEAIIDLSNTLKAHPWICIPHMASDDYIQKLAAFFAEHLDPSLEVYVEISNEIWNTVFNHREYAMEQVAARDDWSSWHDWYADRASVAFKAFTDALGAERVIRVVAGQAANTWHASMIARKLGKGNFDAMACTCYVSGGTSNYDESTTASDIGDALIASIAEKTTGTWRENKELADEFSVPLLAYEGGQHVDPSGDKNASWYEAYEAVQTHPKMGEAYKALMESWYEELGGDLLCFYSSHGYTNAWGAWGVLERYQQDDAVKYDAIVGSQYARTS